MVDAALVVLWMLGVPQPTTPSHPASVASCAREAQELLGAAAVVPSKGLKAPKRIRYVEPAYPSRLSELRGSLWIGEALIDRDGMVRAVSVVKQPSQEISVAIQRAIVQWQYEPTKVDGLPVPVCLIVAVNVDWK